MIRIKTWLIKFFKKLFEILTEKVALIIALIILSFVNINTWYSIRDNFHNQSYVEQIAASFKTNASINQKLEKTKSDLVVINPSLERVYIALFHNGVDSISGLAFLKFSITNETITNTTINTAYQLVQNYPLNILHPVFDDFANGKCVSYNTFDSVHSSVFKEYFMKRGVSTAILCPIIINRNGKEILDGMVVAEFAEQRTEPTCDDCKQTLLTFTEKVQTFIDLNSLSRSSIK